MWIVCEGFCTDFPTEFTSFSFIFISEKKTQNLQSCDLLLVSIYLGDGPVIALIDLARTIGRDEHNVKFGGGKSAVDDNESVPSIYLLNSTKVVARQTIEFLKWIWCVLCDGRRLRTSCDLLCSPNQESSTFADSSPTVISHRMGSSWRYVNLST